jgi:hypothetical protein
MGHNIPNRQTLKLPALLPGLLFSLHSMVLQAQPDRKLEFNIVHRSDVKGTVQLYDHWEGNIRHIKAESLVQTNFLFQISVRTIEEAVYKEGMLIFSGFYQKINDNEKSNRSIVWKNGSYQFIGKINSAKLPDHPVENTILSLYYKEPVNVHEVFSDNFQEYLPVCKTATGQYRVDLPNGNSDFYNYKGGRLVRVEVEQPFYSLQFILKP